MVASFSLSFIASSPHFLSKNTSPSSTPNSISFRRPSKISATFTATRPSMASASPSTTLYEVLDIPMGATCQEIKTAYRKLARVCHPDVVAINRKNTSADEFKKIHAAYLTLSDPQKRSDYDRNFMFRRQRSSFNFSPSTSTSTSSSSGYSGYTSRRSWETDQCW